MNSCKSAGVMDHANRTSSMSLPNDGAILPSIGRLQRSESQISSVSAGGPSSIRGMNRGAQTPDPFSPFPGDYSDDEETFYMESVGPSDKAGELSDGPQFDDSAGGQLKAMQVMRKSYLLSIVVSVCSHCQMPVR